MNLDDRFMLSWAIDLQRHSLYSCCTCGSAVAANDREKHNDWHDEMERSVTSNHEAVEDAAAGEN